MLYPYKGAVYENEMGLGRCRIPDRCAIITFLIKGTVSPEYKCLEVISIKSPLLGYVTPDI
jgi:hypothetical protein